MLTTASSFALKAANVFFFALGRLLRVSRHGAFLRRGERCIERPSLCTVSGRFVSDGSFSVCLYSSRHVLPPLSDAKEGCLCRNRPLEQWSLDYEKEKEVECLLDRLKEHFVTAHPATTQEQREAHKKVNKPHSQASLTAFSRSCCDRRVYKMPKDRFLSNS